MVYRERREKSGFVSAGAGRATSIEEKPALNLLLFDRAVRDNPAMNAIELVGDIDDQHQLHAQVPKELSAGQVRPIVLLSKEDETGGMWAHGIAAEWSAQVQDPREDIYTLDDGRPVHAPLDTGVRARPGG